MQTDTAALSSLRQSWRNAFNRTADVDSSGKLTITPRQIYIVPTRFGLVFGTMLIAMLIGSNNYEINLGFVLTFLLTGTGFAAMVQTWANLSGLEIVPGPSNPVFCGETAEFTLSFRNNRNGSRPGIQVFNGGEPVAFDLDDQNLRQIHYPIQTTTRGKLEPGRWTVFTYFPLGMFYAWAYFHTSQACIVYPQPVPRDSDLSKLFRSRARRRQEPLDSMDFHGHREYQPGDSPRKIDWKALARDRGLLVKEYFELQDDEIWLDWDDVIPQDQEQKLSVLCRAVIELASSQTRYGLRLPGTEIAPDSGARHKAACLTALALF